MDNMSPSNLLRSIRGPILCLLWLFCLATLTSGAATGVNRFSAFSQPVGPFTVRPNDEDEIVVRLPTSHSSVRNFGGGETPRAQQNIGIPLSFSPQTNQPSLARDAQEPHRSPKFFVLNKESNGNANGRINAAVRSHFVAPGSQPRGIPLDAANQASSNGQRLSTGGSSAAVTSAQAHNPSPRFFVLQHDDDLNVNGGASLAGSSVFRENTNGNGAFSAISNGFRVNTNGNGAISARSNGLRGNGNGANVGIPLPFGNQGNVDQQQSRSNGFAQASNPSSTFFVVENSAEVEDNLATMSLGRRFHPNGIPIISDPIAAPSTKEASQKSPEVQSPFLLTPNSLFVLKDDSIEDLQDADLDEQKIVVDLSPMVKAHNHNTANERLSLSNNFLNQYNFVDVKGSTSFGYKTDDQYQDHIVHRSGKHEGKFGWTAPEGSKHHIEYIADEKGYRVITSSGIYLDDEATVKAAKDNHFDEHKKVLDNLASIKRNNVLRSENAPSEQSGTVGIPLPDTMINEQRESLAAAPQPGFVVIESDDDIPLLTQDPEEVVVPIQYSEETFGGVIGSAEQSAAAAGSSASFGIALPEVPARSESSPVETLQSTSSQGGSQFGFTVEDSEDIIVPIQYPEETFGGAATAVEKPLAGEAAISPAFGIPIPESPVRVESSPVEPSQHPSSQGVSQFGFTVEDPEHVVVPIQYPEETFGGAATTAEKPLAGGSASSPTFGIPILESPVRAESSPVEPSQPTSSQDGSQFGITLQDPENVIVPIQYPQESLEGAATAAEQPLAGGTASSPAFGIPIPDSPVRAESSLVEPSQPTSSQDGSQFGITLQDPKKVIVPIQYSQETLGGAATAAEQPLAGGTASSPAFGIPIPDSPVRAESSLVAPSQPTSSQGGSQFGFTVEDPENIIVPIQYPVETFGEAAKTAEKPIAGEAAGSPDFGIPIPESPVKAESSPVEPSQPTSFQDGSQSGVTLQGSKSDIGTAVGGTQLPSEMVKTSVAEEEFSEIFGAPMSSNQKASNVPAAVSVESPKLSVKIGLDKIAPNQIEGFGLGLPSPTQTEGQDMNPITGTGGFTVITEDRPFIALNNVRDNVVAEPETFNAATDNFIPGGSTFSNQFFVVSPTNSNQGSSLFNGQTANIEGNKADGLLQGPAFANNENKNLIRRRS